MKERPRKEEEMKDEEWSTQKWDVEKATNLIVFTIDRYFCIIAKVVIVYFCEWIVRYYH